MTSRTKAGEGGGAKEIALLLTSILNEATNVTQKCVRKHIIGWLNSS